MYHLKSTILNIIIIINNNHAPKRKEAQIHKVINTVSAIRSVHTLKENISKICKSRTYHRTKRQTNEEYDKVISNFFKRNKSLYQVWLEMSHLDYCSANYLHVVGHKTGNDFFVAHPATMQFRQEILRSRSSLCPVPAPSSGLLPGSSLKGASESFPLEKNRRTRRRRERDLATPVECPERRKLLQRVALLEEESFASLIATLPHFADNLSSNSGS